MPPKEGNVISAIEAGIKERGIESFI